MKIIILYCEILSFHYLEMVGVSMMAHKSSYVGTMFYYSISLVFWTTWEHLWLVPTAQNREKNKLYVLSFIIHFGLDSYKFLDLDWLLFFNKICKLNESFNFSLSFQSYFTAFNNYFSLMKTGSTFEILSENYCNLYGNFQ